MFSLLLLLLFHGSALVHMVQLYGSGFCIGAGHVRGDNAVTVQVLAGDAFQHRLGLRVQNALDLRGCGYDSWKGFLLLPVLSVVLGIILIANPFGAMETLVMAIGVILIVEGAINLLSALYTVLAVRRFAKLHPETQSVLESITGEDLNGDGVVAPEVTRTDAEATAVELDHVDESATVEQEERE